MTQSSSNRKERLKKVLIITKSFPPLTGSAVHRPVKFTKYLRQYNYLPIILTAKNYSPLQDDSLLRDLPADIAINRVFSFEPDQLKYFIDGKYKNSIFFRILLRIILKVYSVIYYRLIIPDHAAGWLPLAFLAAIQIIKKDHIDLLYIHAPPFSSFLIGYLLKKWRPYIPLIIDYDDPWTTIKRYYPGNFLQKKIVETLERKVLTRADQVIYCKRSIYESIIKNWPNLSNDKFNFIPNGFDPDDFIIDRNSTGTKKKLRISYTGKLRPYYCYSPISFFKALRILIDQGLINQEGIEIVIAGLISDNYLKVISSLNLHEIVHHLGHVSHSESVSLMKSSDILLFIIENEEGREASEEFSGSLPAKLFEYIYAGKPILAITPPGYEADLFRLTKTGFCAEPNNVDDIKKTLSNLYRRLSDSTLEFNPDWDEIRKYDRNILTGRLAEIFSGLL
jgi:glycosyltransferase involved in cell wall biosynthesis